MKKYFALLMMLGLCVSGFAQTAKARRADGTECAALPCVVASVSLLDQTAPFPQTALLTSTTGGLFRVTQYLESSHIKGSTWGVTFGWTDDLKTWSTGVFQAHAGSISAGTWVVRIIPGQSITYAVTQGNNNPPGTSYYLFVTVEQLQ